MARLHSADMLTHSYFSHEDQAGCGIVCRFSSIKYEYWAIAENIYSMYGYELSAHESAVKIVEGWMNSPGHRANILSETYTVEGVGVAFEGTRIYVTEDFAKPR